MATIESESQGEAESKPRKVEIWGDQVKVNEVTDFYDTITIKGPNGQTEGVQVYRSKDLEFQAIMDKHGGRVVGSGSEPYAAVERAVHTLNWLRGNEQDVWTVDYSK